mgnify:CR=1 FL=1
MCSIEGTTSPDFDIKLFAQANKCRGPDGTGYFKDNKVKFAHNLLAISPNPQQKPQPFITDKGNVLVYNGEIFGLQDNEWDVEWLANYIEEHGIKRLSENVHGMWAFSWYEPSKDKITLCRDHFGIKPLYYTFFNDFLYFSSTQTPLISLRFEWKKEHMNLPYSYCRKFHHIYTNSDGFNPGKHTLLANVFKIMPGQILEIDVGSNKIIGSDNLWNSSFDLKPNYLWDREELEDIAVQCISEVCQAPNINKTISLSGGLDSSLIASVAKNKDNISASSVHWENVNISKKDPSRHMMDELQLSKETTKWLGMDHYVTEIPYNNTWVHDEVYNSMFGMPSWDIQRLLPRFYNITQAAKNNNKIYLSGDCADELLTGYNGDYEIHNQEIKSKNEILNLLSHLGSIEPKEKDIGYRTLREVIPKNIFKDDLVNNRQFVNLLYHSDGFCTVLDHMCGYYGLESRVPFLHQRLAKYLLKIPGQQKLAIDFNGPIKDHKNAFGYSDRKDYLWFMMGHYKGILRDHMAHHYTDNVRNRVRKTGFSNPWDARDKEKNKEMRQEQYRTQKDKVKQEIVDIKDNIMYNLKSELLSEKV